MTKNGGATDERATVYLLDGTYTVFRSFYAIGPLTAPDGTPTNAVFGFVNNVRKLLRDETPDHFGVAFDVEGKTHRDELFSEYKANRGEPPEELVPQFELARRAAEVMRWPVLVAEGYEADDVLATLAKQAVERGLRAVIVTSDKDLYQLVDDDVRVLNPMKGNLLLDPNGVQELFGVLPEFVTDVLALMGDKVDNVPGVPGIGEKGAKTMVRRYGGLDTLLARAHDFAAAWAAKDEALTALEAKDDDALAAALAELAAPAERLAAREEGQDDDVARDLHTRFSEAAGLASHREELKPREIKKALKELEKKTQPKVWRSLSENEEAARFSHRLVVVLEDAPVTLDLEETKLGEASALEAASFFRELGFRRLSEEFERAAEEGVDAEESAAVDSEGGEAKAARAGEAMEVELFDAATLASRLAELAKSGALAVDTETTGLDPRSAQLLGVSLASGGDGGAYLALSLPKSEEAAPVQESLLPLEAPEDTPSQDPRKLEWTAVAPALGAVLEDPALSKIGQNLKFDRAVLRSAGVELAGITFDTLLAAQLLEPGRTVSHKLDDLAWRYLGVRMISYEELAGSGDAERPLDELALDDVARYAVEDAAVTWRLAEHLGGLLDEAGLRRVFEELEMPLLPVLEEMEAHGIRVDVEQLAAMSKELATELERLEGEIHELAGHPFNIGSPKQLRTVLFEELGLVPSGRRTQKTKAHSTGQEALEALAAEHPLPAKVLEYRELSKLKSTYVDALPKLVDPRDGRVHTHFQQLGAATGRMSSTNPNLQNIPIRTPLGRRIREAFVPEPGWKLISADYSQMELRVLAHLSGDEALLRAFREGLDIHRYTAALVEGVPLEEVDASGRARAKAVNFGIVYGMSEFRLAREQDMSREDARAFIDAYFERYPAVREYIDGVTASVAETGEVRTLWGRVRAFPELAGDGEQSRLNRMQREQLLRQAVNTTVQGTAADIVKNAMVRVAARLRAESLEARLLLQVHDELVLEAPEAELEAVHKLLEEEMMAAAELDLPLLVEVHEGENWSSAH